jgi:hypothetical protein
MAQLIMGEDQTDLPLRSRKLAEAQL